jgi:hypothetical protein
LSLSTKRSKPTTMVRKAVQISDAIKLKRDHLHTVEASLLSRHAVQRMLESEIDELTNELINLVLERDGE